MIDILDSELQVIVAILSKHVPDCEVIAYGSRITGKSWQYSDLDIAIIGNKPLTSSETGNLREEFEESDLPFRVDFHDWHDISESFRAIIRSNCETIYQPTKTTPRTT